MSNSVESKIVVNILALVNGTPRVKELADAVTGVGNSSSKSSPALGKMSVNTDKLTQAFDRAEAGAHGLVAAIVGLGEGVKGEFARFDEAGRKIKAFVDAEERETARLEAIRARQAALNARDSVYANGRDPFAQGVNKYGETTLERAGQDINTVANAEAMAKAAENAERFKKDLQELDPFQTANNVSLAQTAAEVERLTAGYTPLQEKLTELDPFQKANNVNIAQSGAALAQAETAGTRYAGFLSAFTTKVKAGSSGFLGLSVSTRTASVDLLGFTLKGEGASAMLVRLIANVKLLVSMLALVAAAAVTGAVVAFAKKGVDFNSEIEQNRLGIAQIVTQMSEITENGKKLTGVDAFKAAQQIALDYFEKVKVASLQTGQSVETITEAFKNAIPAGERAKLTLDQILDVTVNAARAAKAFGIDDGQFKTQLRQLLQGTANARNQLAANLFGSGKEANAQVKALSEQGKLYDVLIQKLGVYKLTAFETSQTFAALATNAGDVLKYFSALATVKLFEEMKTALGVVVQRIFSVKDGTLQLNSSFLGLANFLNNVFGDAGAKIVEWVKLALDYVAQFSGWLSKYDADVNQIVDILTETGSQVLGLIYDVLQLIGDLLGAVIVDSLGQAADKTDKWGKFLLAVKTTFGVINILIGITRDLIRGLVGAIEVVGGAIIRIIAAPLRLIFKALSYLPLVGDSFQKALDFMNAVDSFGDSVVTRGTDNFVRLEDNSATAEAINNLRTAGTTPEKAGANKKRRTGLRANPLGGSADDNSKALEKLQNRLAQLREQTANLMRELYDSQVDMALASAEKTNAIQSAQNEFDLSELDKALNHKLTSIQEYYKAKNKLDQAQIEIERKNAQNQYDTDAAHTQNRIDAINEKFDAELAAPKNKNAQIQAELVDQRDIEIQKEKNALKEKETKLEQTLEELKIKGKKADQDNFDAQHDALLNLAATNKDVQAQLLESQGREADAAFIKIAAQFKDTLKETLINTNTPTDALRGVIEDIDNLGAATTGDLNNLLEQAGIKFDDLSTETKNLIALMKQLEGAAQLKGFQTGIDLRKGKLELDKADVQDKVNRSVITEEEGRRQILKLEQDAKKELELILQKAMALPGLTDQQKLALFGVKQELDKLGRDVDTLGKQINQVAAQDFGNFFDTILEGNQSIGDSFRQLFSSLLIDIAKAIFQATVLKAILSALKIGTGDDDEGGGFGGFFSKLVGGAFADGGEVGGDGSVSGPGTGRSDSILARLSHGEWVIPAHRVIQYGRGIFASLTNGTFGRTFSGFADGGPVGNVMSAAAGFGRGIRIVNTVHPRLALDALQSSEGEDVFRNMLTSNQEFLISLTRG